MPKLNIGKGKEADVLQSLYESKQRRIFINIVMPLLAAISVLDIISCLLNPKETSYLTFFLFLIHAFICIASFLLVRDSAKSSFYILIGYCCYFLLVLGVPLILGIISQRAYTQYFYDFSAVTGMSIIISLTLKAGAWLTVVMRVIFLILAFLFFAYFLREIVKLQPLFNGETPPAKAKKSKAASAKEKGDDEEIDEAEDSDEEEMLETYNPIEPEDINIPDDINIDIEE